MKIDQWDAVTLESFYTTEEPLMEWRQLTEGEKIHISYMTFHFHLCVCLCVYMTIYACVCATEGHRSTSRIFLYSSPSNFWGNLSMNLKLLTDWLTWLLILAYSCLCWPVPGWHPCTIVPTFFYVDTGLLNAGPHCVSKYFAHWAIFPAAPSPASC